jgi:hypothetical protein
LDTRDDAHIRSPGEELDSFGAGSERLGIGNDLLCLISSGWPFTDADTSTVMRDGQHDFDFNIGVWKTHIKRFLDPFEGGTKSI